MKKLFKQHLREYQGVCQPSMKCLGGRVLVMWEGDLQVDFKMATSSSISSAFSSKIFSQRSHLED